MELNMQIILLADDKKSQWDTKDKKNGAIATSLLNTPTNSSENRASISSGKSHMTAVETVEVEETDVPKPDTTTPVSPVKIGHHQVLSDLKTLSCFLYIAISRNLLSQTSRK